MKNKVNRFYKTSPHGNVGSNLSFWAKDGKGYTTNLDLAEIYSFAEAQDEVNKGHLRGDDEFPISADHVDKESILKVDCQYIKTKYPEDKDPNNEYVAYKQKYWDGNDLPFISETGHNFNYSKARVFNERDIANLDFDGYIVIPKYAADKASRRTFEWHKVNRRKMIQGVGIVGVRKSRKRHTSGKERFNCPCCGRINWQYNPYDFEGCSNIECEEWKPYYERCYIGE